MAFVLVVITAFSTSGGVATQTAFHEFGTATACEAARAGVLEGVDAMKGTIGRSVFAACFPTR